MAVAATVEKVSVWDETLARLRGQMTEASFNSTLRGSVPVQVEGRCWTIGAPAVALEWLEHRLRAQVEATLAGVTGGEVELAFVPHPLSQGARGATMRVLPPVENGNGHGAPAAFKLMSAYEVMTTEWPEPVWVAPGLPTGLAILAGKPKIGKSWLALQLCRAVAQGDEVLGEKVAPGRFLYLALEDHPKRLRQRMEKQRWPVEDQLKLSGFILREQFEREIGDLGSGGSEVLAEMISRGKYRLVVIDTFSRAIRGDQNDNDTVTMSLGPIQEAAYKLNCVVLLLDHHRKLFSAEPDVVVDILGSTAKAAVADALWGLYRERGRPGAKLSMIGKDFEERTILLQQNPETGLWALDGNGDPHALELTERRQEILDALADLGRARVGEIAKAIEQNRGNTYSRLQDLVNAGLVVRALGEDDGGIWYELARGQGD